MKPRIGISAAPVAHDQRPGYKVNRAYVDAVVRAGGVPSLVPVLDPALAADVVAGLDGLLLTGGGDVSPACYGQLPSPELYDVNPERDRWEVALIEAAGLADMAVLGVCRGAQILNVASGGSLVQDLPAVTDEPHGLRRRETEEVHTVGIEPASLLAEVVGQDRLGVNSLHHQGVAGLGQGLRAVAWAPDGVIEAIETTEDRPVLAVQWHPELMIGHPRHQRLFDWLVHEAGGRVATARRPQR